MNKKSAWGRVFYFSCVIHFSLLFILVFTPLVRPKPKIIEFKLMPPMEMVPIPKVEKVIEPKVIEEEVIEETVLPQKVDPIQKQIVIPEKPKPKPKPKIKPKPKPKVKKKILKKKKVKVKKKNLLTAEQRRRLLEKKLKSIDKKAAKAKPTQMSGVMTTQYFPYQYYLVGLQSKVTQSWEIPSHLALEKELNLFVTFTIARNGSVSGVRLKSSSGKQAFDQSALKAVEAASPFPPLPDEYKEQILELTIRFQLDE